MDLRSIFDLQKLKKLDQLEPRQYRAAIIALVSLVVLMAVSGIIAFFLTLRGEEQTLVPNVVDLDLSAALVKLQEKELYPRISLRFSSDPESEGRILEQEPLPGAIVKAGRRIALVVSRGAAQDQVGNYIGQNLEEVRSHLQTLFGTTRQLVTVKDPPVYLFDTSPSGTILEQSPASGTDLSEPTQLTFVVSRGPERAKVKVPDLIGLSLNEATLLIEKSSVAFKFVIRPTEGLERPGTIVAQLPEAGTLQDPMNPVSLVFGSPAQAEGLVTGLFSYTLPEYPYPLRVILYAESPTRARIPLISVDHPGGLFTLPYALPEKSVLELQVLSRVVARVEIRR